MLVNFLLFFLFWCKNLQKFWRIICWIFAWRKFDST